MRPEIKLLCLGVLFAFGLLCCRIFEFERPLLNYIFFLSVATLPFFALAPLRKLPKWRKRIGVVVLSPLLFLDSCAIIGFFACGSPELHHYQSGSCIQEVQRIDRHTYSVDWLTDCGGGATVRNFEWIEQRTPVLPGLYVVRTVASFYGVAGETMAFMVGNTLQFHRKEVDENGQQDYTYILKPHVYF